MNHLRDETSPYLRQHVDNPVDWYPWGEEAFDLARSTDRPVLLSVGYSACHWCHVMAHECFEDDETAALMNSLFVNIKVDREERPDVDAIYMDAVQAISGHGGWPMTVFLFPDGRPFFGGTYFPKEQFDQLLNRIAELWGDERNGLDGRAAALTADLARYGQLEGSDSVVPADVLDTAVVQLRTVFDDTWGGFGAAPKFPQTMNLELLLRHHRRTGDPNAHQMARLTLDAMASGGMYDHIGGGFARYSTDRAWMVPHFEKMLYDQALLARLYVHAWQLLGHDDYRLVFTETLDYALAQLRDPSGGFYSAEDADSEGVEGKFYVFTPEQVEDVLGDDAPKLCEWFGITPEGNFEGSSIPHRPLRGSLQRDDRIEELRRRLEVARASRVRPGLDDKVLTEWNALMILALIDAGAATGRDDWIEAATDCAEFLLREMRGENGRWLRSWHKGRTRHLACAGDLAAAVDAFTRLGEVTGSARWTDEALTAADQLLSLFRDPERGGFFTTGSDAEPLITRPKDLIDGALPSANSLAAVSLLRLSALTGRDDLASAARSAVRLVSEPASNRPAGFGHLLGAVELIHHAPAEVVVAGDRPDMVSRVLSSWRPDVVLAWGERRDSPLWQSREDGRAYVCRNYVCGLPAQSPDDLEAQLQN